jgi:hypothetical protein
MTRTFGAFQLAALLFPSVALAQQFPYQYTDTFSSDSIIDNVHWKPNGAGLSLNTTAGLTTTDANGGSLIYQGQQLDNSYEYEVKAVLKLTQSASNDAYGLYLRASQDALNTTAASGTYYALEIQDVQLGTDSQGNTTCAATYVLWERVNGTVHQTNTAQLRPMLCNDHTMTVRLVYTNNNNAHMIVAYIDDNEFFLGSNTDISMGQPGVGVRNAPAGNGIVSVSLCNLDRVLPSMVSNPLISSVFPDHIDLKFGGEVDNSGGVGVAFLLLYRNGTPIVGTAPGHWHIYGPRRHP